MSRITPLFLSLVLILISSTSSAKPNHLDIKLENLTTLTLNFYPGMGTRFTFPFLLDNEDDYVPYTNDNTNSIIFMPIKRQSGRNFFIITIPPGHISEADDIGNMFITVAGYQISIEMHSTKNRKEHVSDVRFLMGEKAREDLIQHAIVQRTKSLEQAYHDKLAQLEVQTEKRALGKIGMLALYEPDEVNIKEESVLELKNGDETILFVNYALIYPEYTIFSFEIENDSATNHVAIQDAKLFAIDGNGGQKIPLDTAKEIPRRVEPRGSATGVIVVDNTILDRDKRLTLEVLTDGGVVQAVW
jgi:hypothetical protein